MKNFLHSVTLILGLLSFRSSLADQYFIPSGSMLPTIQIGDRVFVNKMAYDLRVPFTSTSLVRTSEPTRGDVIVFTDPRDPGRNLIKRLAAVPGDRVRVLGDGSVEINGSAPDARTVPSGHYFFLGDNRDNSSDSRVWGLARREHLKGKALKVFFPLIRNLSPPAESTTI